MFGFGKKKFSVEQAQNIIQTSILAHSTVRNEARYMFQTVFQLNDTGLKCDEFDFIKVLVLLKSQIVFSAIAKNNDISIYDKIRERIINWVENTYYEVEFDEYTEFSVFNRFKTDFAEKSDVYDLIISLGLSFELAITKGEVRLNTEAQKIFYQSVEHHLYETNKAIEKMIIVS